MKHSVGRLMTQLTLSASPYGGEHTIGTITQEQGHFWLEMGNELFTQYLHFQDDLNEKWNIPENLKLTEFYEIDDIDHINAPEFEAMNRIEVVKVNDDHSKETVAEIDCATNEARAMVLFADEPADHYKGDSVIVYAQSFAKGNWDTTIEVEDDFDVTKLWLLCSAWSDYIFITGFGYNDAELDFDGWEENSIGKSNSAWVHEDTLKMNQQEWCDDHVELMRLITSIKMKEGETLVA
jgi:hypothetical protein